MKIVIAGNYREYRDYLRANGLSERDAHFVDRNEKLLGLEIAESDIVRTGNWQDAGIDEALLRARIRK